MAGSYAGALGIPQFMPSSYRHHARTTIPNHSPNLFTNKQDAIASVGNYLHHFGWTPGETPVIALDTSKATADQMRFGTTYDASALKAAHIIAKGTLGKDAHGMLTQIDGHSEHPSTWLTMHNFDVIKKYNKSPLYALAVSELAEQIAR